MNYMHDTKVSIRIRNLNRQTRFNHALRVSLITLLSHPCQDIIRLLLRASRIQHPSLPSVASRELYLKASQCSRCHARDVMHLANMSVSWVRPWILGAVTLEG